VPRELSSGDRLTVIGVPGGLPARDHVSGARVPTPVVHEQEDVILVGGLLDDRGGFGAGVAGLADP
jgi:hypothetical protein